MSGAHFYITLPSNASLDIFPDNKTTSYRVKLPHTINLNGEWEVGLYSISYPNTWYTLRDINKDTHIYYKDKDGFYSVIDLNYGHYETIQDLIKNVNSALAKYAGKGNVVLSLNTLTGKVKVQLKSGYRLILYGKMSIILGFGAPKERTEIAKTSESPYVADLQIITTIYVYNNILQPQIVGDTSAKLLKTIPVEGKYGDVIMKTFTNIQYVPIQAKSFEDMEILLRTDTGEPVPFERGKVVTTLHFRQHSYTLPKDA